MTAMLVKHNSLYPCPATANVSYAAIAVKCIQEWVPEFTCIVGIPP